MQDSANLANLLSQMSQDKLRVSNGLFIKTLLCLTYQMHPEKTSLLSSPLASKQLDLEEECQLFKELCVYVSFCCAPATMSPGGVSSYQRA
jgi:hypothetical protein